MNKLCIVSLFLYCFLLISCENKSTSAIVSAQVYKEPHFNIGGSKFASPLAYRVKVSVKNVGNNPIIYDTAVSAFTPANGRPLLNKTYIDDGTKGTSNTEEDYIKDLTTDTITPGSSRIFNASTNGFTFKLLTDSGDLPLAFIFTLIRGDSKPALTVVGPYAGYLPDLEDLPLHSVDDATQGKILDLHLRQR